jgi:hypothetical protein
MCWRTNAQSCSAHTNERLGEEIHLWALRSEMTNPLGEKWPRPVDSARNLYEYCEYQIAQSGVLFAKYDRLADAAAAK